MHRHTCQHIHVLAPTWIHEMCNHGNCRREREHATHWHKKPRPLCGVFWRSFGGERWERATMNAEKVIQVDRTKYCFYQDEKVFLIPATFPLEGWKSKACATCNELHIETSFIPCAPAVTKTNYFLIIIIKKKTI